jgi:hypothetical protein
MAAGEWLPRELNTSAYAHVRANNISQASCVACEMAAVPCRTAGAVLIRPAQLSRTRHKLRKDLSLNDRTFADKHCILPLFICASRALVLGSYDLIYSFRCLVLKVTK